MSLFQWIDFQKLGDERGSLVAIEIGKEKAVPFEIKRVYYSYETRSDVRRGLHAHKELKQVAICVSGSCRMVFDDGNQRQEKILDIPEKGLLIDKMIWHEMYDFSPDCVLLVLASDHYNEDDYIRSYSEFIKVARR
jgi:dTDP-4-dehydrorhamnose 3,5-epimerase-like enzyme